MPDWLSPEWAEEMAGLCPLLPEARRANGAVSCAFVVARKNEVAVHWSYQDGKPSPGTAGPDPGADLTLSLAAADAADLLSGRVDPSVAFMRGRLKASGDGGLLLAFLESTTSPGYQEWREAVARLAPVP